jgi:hypothetical protein
MMAYKKELETETSGLQKSLTWHAMPSAMGA